MPSQSVHPSDHRPSPGCKQREITLLSPEFVAFDEPPAESAVNALISPLATASAPSADLLLAALVDADLFEAANAILTERGEDVSKRATVSSDYLLTGLITCSSCGKHYIGTAAHGRKNRYRYYTCWSRNRLVLVMLVASQTDYPTQNSTTLFLKPCSTLITTARFLIEQ